MTLEGAIETAIIAVLLAAFVWAVAMFDVAFDELEGGEK